MKKRKVQAEDKYELIICPVKLSDTSSKKDNPIDLPPANIPVQQGSKDYAYEYSMNW